MFFTDQLKVASSMMGGEGGDEAGQSTVVSQGEGEGEEGNCTIARLNDPGFVPPAAELVGTSCPMAKVLSLQLTLIQLTTED